MLLLLLLLLFLPHDAHGLLQLPGLDLLPLDRRPRVLEPVDDVVDVERLPSPPRVQRVELLHVLLNLKIRVKGARLQKRRFMAVRLPGYKKHFIY